MHNRTPRVSTSASDRGPPGRLGQRLAAARHFVGRAAELELLRVGLAAQPPPFAVLHVYGPGGVGKTSLLQQYLRLARAAGRLAVLLDGRNVDASPPAFQAALAQALGLPEAQAPLRALEQAADPVLLLDTYEVLAPLDGWLRETFLPQLPAGALTVIAGRNPPGAGWRAAGEWQALARSVSLRNLRSDESLAYLAGRGVPPAQRPGVLRFTHGHPLALSLVADLAVQAANPEGEAGFHPEQVPDVVVTLLERFIERVPSGQHRLALHTCAIARVLTEPILREALGEPDVQAVFEWLRGLSFIEAGPFGLYPHDLAREVLDSDLRWRDPDAHAALHQRVRGYLFRRLSEGQGVERLRLMFDLVFLHRHNPILQPYYQWQAFGTHYVEPLAPADHSRALRLIAAFTNEDIARQAQHWLARQPEAWSVIRDGRGEMAGLFAYLALHATTPEDRRHDPALAAAWDCMLQPAPLRPGDEASLARIFSEPGAYRQASAVMNTAQLAIGLRWLTNPRLAWSFTHLFNADYWQAMMSYYDFRRVADPSLGLYAHDWRAVPPAAWLELMGGRELATDLRAEDLARATPPALLVLSRPDFAEAVKDALRDFQSLPALAGSPLLRSRLAAEAGGGAPAASELQRLLRSAAEGLRGSPKGEKHFRALEATYFTPSPTQEQAAERLGLPFSTYRYHLARGIARLTEQLWRDEVQGSEG